LGNWDLVGLPPGKKAIGNKWVYSLKDDAKAQEQYDEQGPWKRLG